MNGPSAWPRSQTTLPQRRRSGPKLPRLATRMSWMPSPSRSTTSAWAGLKPRSGPWLYSTCQAGLGHTAAGPGPAPAHLAGQHVEAAVVEQVDEVDVADGRARARSGMGKSRRWKVTGGPWAGAGCWWSGRLRRRAMLVVEGDGFLRGKSLGAQVRFPKQVVSLLDLVTPGAAREALRRRIGMAGDAAESADLGGIGLARHNRRLGAGLPEAAGRESQARELKATSRRAALVVQRPGRGEGAGSFMESPSAGCRPSRRHGDGGRRGAAVRSA